VDKKIILWSIALFFGCSILFRAVADATVGTSKGVAFAVQAGVLVLVIAVVVAVVKRRTKP
jgi:uncharacterized membrane protein HdeD (DUF308 family)